MKALSIRQPWVDAILYGGKRIENRLAWRGSDFRGEFLIHASSGMTGVEYAEAVRFCERRGISWRPRAQHLLTRGAIVGRARVVDVIMPDGFRHPGEGYASPCVSHVRHELAADPFYMGGFALVLEDVEPLRAYPWKGSLGFFEVPSVDAFERAYVIDGETLDEPQSGLRALSRGAS